MREWLVLASENAIVLIDALALIVIVAGSVEAFAKALYVAVFPSSAMQSRDIWLRFGRWLVAALTFQLAADVIETAITTDWDAIGRLGAIAVIRTFLNYFLEKDLREVYGERQDRETGSERT